MSNLTAKAQVGEFKEFLTVDVTNCSSDNSCSGNDCDGSDGGCGSCDND